MKEIILDSDTIKLDQFLKWADIVGTGGEAKIIISEGKVKVNGEIVLQRSKKLINQDVVEVNSFGFYRVITGQ